MKLPEFLTDDAYNEIRLTGHRIGLFTIVRDYKEGRTAEWMAEEYPSLPLDLIRAVIGFYLENQTEVDAYVKAYQEEIDRQAALPLGPGELRMRRLIELIRKADEEHKADPGWSKLSIMEKLQRIEGAEFTGTA